MDKHESYISLSPLHLSRNPSGASLLPSPTSPSSSPQEDPARSFTIPDERPLKLKRPLSISPPPPSLPIPPHHHSSSSLSSLSSSSLLSHSASLPHTTTTASSSSSSSPAPAGLAAPPPSYRPFPYLSNPPTGPFVSKLYMMLQDPSSQHLISFTENGDSFVVTNPTEFAREILPKHFKHSNFSSFVRQLNMYNFHKANKVPRSQRGTADSQEWEFTHPHFKRGRPDLLDKIKRGSGESAGMSNNSSSSSIGPPPPLPPPGPSPVSAVHPSSSSSDAGGPPCTGHQRGPVPGAISTAPQPNYAPAQTTPTICFFTPQATPTTNNVPTTPIISPTASIFSAQQQHTPALSPTHPPPSPLYPHLDILQRQQHDLFSEFHSLKHAHSQLYKSYMDINNTHSSVLNAFSRLCYYLRQSGLQIPENLLALPEEQEQFQQQQQQQQQQQHYQQQHVVPIDSPTDVTWQQHQPPPIPHSAPYEQQPPTTAAPPTQSSWFIQTTPHNQQHHPYRATSASSSNQSTSNTTNNNTNNNNSSQYHHHPHESVIPQQQPPTPLESAHTIRHASSTHQLAAGDSNTFSHDQNYVNV